MTIKEFLNQLRVNKINLHTVGGHYYAEGCSVKLNINKDIFPSDFKKQHTFKVIRYLDEYVISKNGFINQYGLKISGNWKDGYAMENHTTKSKPAEVSETGEVLSWNTHRPPISEELYRLKYWRENNRVDKIASPAADFLKRLNKKWNIDVILPVPPSNTGRYFQPVEEMASAIGSKLNLPVDLNYLVKTKHTAELKGITDPDERKRELKGAFTIKDQRCKGKNVLIFDDLYRSGATLNEVTDLLLTSGEVNNVFVLTITKTRKKR